MSLLPNGQLDVFVQGLVESPKHFSPPSWFDIWICLLWTPEPQETLQWLHNDHTQSTEKHMKYISHFCVQIKNVFLQEKILIIWMIDWQCQLLFLPEFSRNSLQDFHNHLFLLIGKLDISQQTRCYQRIFKNSCRKRADDSWFISRIPIGKNYIKVLTWNWLGACFLSTIS